MASTNPDPDSWVLDWILWYLDENGYPRADRCGVVRYFLIVNDSPVFADTAEELALEYPELCYDTDNDGNEIYIEPMTFCFIGGTIYDNPALIKANPKYLSALKAQSKVNRARLLDGCWFARAEGSNVFDRNWLHKRERSSLPKDLKFVRAWDKAYSEPSDVNRHPDFTTSVKMAKDKSGMMYIFGDYDPDTLDEKTMIMGKFRKRPGERDQLIEAQALYDEMLDGGKTCTIILPKDPAAGVVEYQEASKKLNQEGFIVKPDPTASNQKKMIRFMPFSSACQNGSVCIVEDSFGNRATLEAFYKELESFNGERSTASRKDDIPDVCASAYNALCKEKVYTAVSIPSINAPTLKHKAKM